MKKPSNGMVFFSQIRKRNVALHKFLIPFTPVLEIS